MMRDLPKLIDAICDVYDRSDLQPKPDGTTFCNVAVCSIADAMGCKDLFNKTADEILSFLQGDPNWSEVPMEKVQDIVNQGTLVIAGLESKALGEAHGHVVVVRPGMTCYSGKWGAVPRIVNIGIENFISRAKRGPAIGMPVGINEAFVPIPRFYVWRISL